MDLSVYIDLNMTANQGQSQVANFKRVLQRVDLHSAFGLYVRRLAQASGWSTEAVAKEFVEKLSVLVFYGAVKKQYVPLLPRKKQG